MIQVHTIVHIEDDAPHWRSLTQSLYLAIREQLGERSVKARGTLRMVRPKNSHEFPTRTCITWNDGVDHEISYWFVTTERVDGAIIKLQPEDNPTFVLDVMRPGPESGLASSVNETLSSISPYISDCDAQVRLFTAYSQADGAEIPDNAPKMFKKGLETDALLEFLLERVGFGGG